MIEIMLISAFSSAVLFVTALVWSISPKEAAQSPGAIVETIISDPVSTAAMGFEWTELL